MVSPARRGPTDLGRLQGRDDLLRQRFGPDLRAIQHSEARNLGWHFSDPTGIPARKDGDHRFPERSRCAGLEKSGVCLCSSRFRNDEHDFVRVFQGFAQSLFPVLAGLDDGLIEPNVGSQRLNSVPELLSESPVVSRIRNEDVHLEPTTLMRSFNSKT